MNIQEEGISFNSAESKQLTEVEIQRRGEVETQLWRKGQQDCGPGVGDSLFYFPGAAQGQSPHLPTLELSIL